MPPGPDSRSLTRVADSVPPLLPPPRNAPDSDEEGTPVDFLGMIGALWRRKWIVLAITAAFGVAAFLWVRSQPPVYRARAVIQLVDGRRALAGSLGNNTDDRSGSSVSMLSEIEVIKSRAIASEVADSELVRPGANASARERLTSVVLNGLDASPRKQTNLIDLTFRSNDPDVAKRVVNRVAFVYQSASTRISQQQSRRRSEFIEQQLSKYDQQLAGAEHALSSFRTNQQAYTSAEKFSAQQSGLADYRIRERDLDAERAIVRGVLEGMESTDRARRDEAFRMLSSSPGLSTNATVGRLYAKLDEYETKVAEQTTGAWSSAPTHPEVQRLDTLIANTRAELTDAVRAHVRLLDARVKSLQDLVSSSASSLRQLPSAEAEETRLVQNADALRQQTALLRTELQQARIAEAASVGQVEIIDLATRSTANITALSRVLVFALAFGVLCGGGLAILLERLDRTIKRRDEIELSLQLPVLATIPRIAVREVKANGNGRSLPSSRSLGLARLSRSDDDTAAITEEAFRQLRTGLLYSWVPGAPLRRILVTSPVQGDGKTSIAANLGIVLAQQGYSVIAIDCDMHAPRLHRAFQLPLSPGLGDILTHQLKGKEYVQETSVPNLFVLAAGSVNGSPGDLVGGQSMKELLDELSQRFDMVILDTAPVLAVSDSVILSTNADAVLLVVRAGRTTPVDATDAIRYLTTVGARVAGVVLNDPEERVRQYGGYYRGSARYARAT